MDKPNIVFILADDMGYGDVGCYNSVSKIPTPNMDKLATGGMMFTDMHSPSAVCTPTRYGILTGRYCWRSTLSRGVLCGYEPPLIPPNRMTLAKMLQESGYHTACIGKWHLGLGFGVKAGEQFDFSAPLPWENASREDEEKIDFSAPVTGGPLDLGFDTAFFTSGCSTAQPPYGFIKDRHFVERPSEYRDKIHFTGRTGMTSPGWSHKDADPTFTQKAVEYIESRSGKSEPFFLYLPASAPHEPCLPLTVPDFAKSRSSAGSRGDLVWLFDWMVGQVLDALETAGQLENTLIMVTSDNGALPGDRIASGRDMDSYASYNHLSCGDWRGYKAHIWEGGHREPFIVSWPGKVRAGSRCPELCCMTDVIAACASIVGYDLPNEAAEDSYDMLPSLLERKTDRPRRRDIVHHSSLGAFSFRQNEWKLIVDTLGSGGWPPPSDVAPVDGSPGQLYNLADDPGESDNLYDKNPQKVKELAEVLERYRTEGRSTHRR